MQSFEKQGILVTVLESRLTVGSRAVLREILAEVKGKNEVVCVAGMGRAAVVKAWEDGGKIYYNTDDYVPFSRLMDFLPWREVWLVAGGRGWRTTLLDVVAAGGGGLDMACSLAEQSGARRHRGSAGGCAAG